jgi:hypothetical protein
MGTWGHKTFESDGALDFTAELVEGDKSLIKDAILKVVEIGEEDYLEAPDCENALVAIEFIAAHKGNPSADFPGDATDWVKRNDLLVYKTGIFGKRVDIIELSKKAIDRILANSELKELWEEGKEGEEWKKGVVDLRNRVQL